MALAQEALLPEYLEVMNAEWLAGRLAPLLADKKKLREVSTTLRSLYSWDARPAEDLVEIISR